MSTLIATRASSVEAVIRSAWRRKLFVLGVEELGFASSVVFAGAIVMLLLGTQILDWYWLVLLAGAGFLIGGIRVRRRVMNFYKVAQVLDDRLELNDYLSTAWFLLTLEGKFDQSAAGYQISRAEEIATGVQATAAFPFTRQRSWNVAGAMACAVLSLFAIRYFVTNSLSLRPSLIPLRFSVAGERTTELKRAANKDAGYGLPLNKEFMPQELRNPETEASVGSQTRSARQGSNGQGDENAKSAAERAGERATGSGRETEDEHRSATADSSKQGQQAGDRGSEQQQSPGLMDKMKDALSGLMAKMRQKSPSQKNQSQEGRSASADDKRKGQTAQSKDETGQSRDGEQQRADASSEAQAQSQTAEKSSQVGADSDHGPQGKGSDSQSGAGRQDGEKSLTDAEQLKAMGRLAEIIGKRSASLTGEMTVEKSSGQQQLQTQYSQRSGHHADLGGEINRDEIPFEYRAYIREYMTRIHKQAETKH